MHERLALGSISGKANYLRFQIVWTSVCLEWIWQIRITCSLGPNLKRVAIRLQTVKHLHNLSSFKQGDQGTTLALIVASSVNWGYGPWSCAMLKDDLWAIGKFSGTVSQNAVPIYLPVPCTELLWCRGFWYGNMRNVLRTTREELEVHCNSLGTGGKTSAFNRRVWQQLS